MVKSLKSNNRDAIPANVESSGSIDWTRSRFGERLTFALRGESPHAFGRRANIPDSTLRKYLADTMPGLIKLIELSTALDVTLDWLAKGVGPMQLSAMPGPGLLTVPSSEFALLPRYNVSASAGPGRIVAEEEGVIERLAFRHDWLHEMGIDPKSAGLLTASGDSMSPTIPDGALMLVVRGNDEPVRSGYIYVIVLNGEVLVKRVSRNVDGSLDLISDNKIYPVQNVRQVDFERLYIAGRVFWIGFKL